MAIKHRIEGPEAVIAFVHDTRLPFGPQQSAQADLLVSAKAGDKWRLTRVTLPVDFAYADDTLEIHIESIGTPFYRKYRSIPGTQFVYDTLKSKLFIEGHLNKGRGDPFVILISR
ncbi:hypothetical protein CR155_12840 [Pollutimonas nitritireducens]|uniref:Uncharacterized protein n=1 Tax=Pollutimonas nitritireducens TaxID=2045209 RepID=A0A2N4UF84_9BURK|nr:hypothetical protein [Pollutimonas nitritireducens]PLC53682.1 hypothetical protein CR155_12840 [Pollutimonas nitritireducens]